MKQQILNYLLIFKIPLTMFHQGHFKTAMSDTDNKSAKILFFFFSFFLLASSNLGSDPQLQEESVENISYIQLTTQIESCSVQSAKKEFFVHHPNKCSIHSRLLVSTFGLTRGPSVSKG